MKNKSHAKAKARMIWCPAMDWDAQQALAERCESYIQGLINDGTLTKN